MLISVAFSVKVSKTHKKQAPPSNQYDVAVENLIAQQIQWLATLKNTAGTLLSALDTDGDGKLSEDEFSAYLANSNSPFTAQDVFDKFDSDHDSFLDVDELSNALEYYIIFMVKQGGSNTQANNVANNVVNNTSVNSTDVNNTNGNSTDSSTTNSYQSTGNPVLDQVASQIYAEATNYAAIWTQTQQTAQGLFGMIDTDNSGSISVDELNTYLQTYHPELNAQAIVSAYDTNGDGSLDINEFTNFVNDTVSNIAHTQLNNAEANAAAAASTATPAQ